MEQNEDVKNQEIKPQMENDLKNESNEEIDPALNPFNRKELKESTNKGLDKITIEDLIIKNCLTQAVPIAKDVLVVFKTLTGDDRMAINVMAITQLAGSIKNLIINGEDIFLAMQPPVGDRAEAYDAYMIAKFNKINKLSENMAMLLSQHLVWFIERVNNAVYSNAYETVQNFCQAPSGEPQR
jgi:DNA phosphorothioation-dependent restriction protein DptG